MNCDFTTARVYLKEHVKKLAFLAGHSPKALTSPPPYQLAEQKRFYAFFFIYGQYMFLKPANSDTENGIRKQT